MKSLFSILGMEVLPQKKNTLEVQGFKNWRAKNFGWNSDSLHLIGWVFWNFGSVPKVCFLYIPHLCKGKGPFSWRFLRFLRQLQTASRLHPRTGKLNWQSGNFYGTFTSLIHLYIFYWFIWLWIQGRYGHCQAFNFCQHFQGLSHGRWIVTQMALTWKKLEIFVNWSLGW